jgi:hypothetical protein
MATINLKTFIIACFKPLMWALREQSDAEYNKSLSQVTTHGQSITALTTEVHNATEQLDALDTSVNQQYQRLAELIPDLPTSERIHTLEINLAKQKILYEKLYNICNDLITNGSTDKVLPNPETPFISNDELLIAFKESLGHDSSYELTDLEMAGYENFKVQYLSDHPDRIYYTE